MGCVGALFQAEFADHLVDPGPALGLRGVLREAQLGGVAEGPAHGQLGVQDVVLRHQADALAQLGVVAVEVAAVVEHGALVGGAQAGEGVEQRGLARRRSGRRRRAGTSRPPGRRRGRAASCGRWSTVTARSWTSRETSPVSTYSCSCVADQAERGVADADDVARADAGAR